MATLMDNIMEKVSGTDAWYQETPQRPPNTFKGAASDCGLSLPGSTPSKRSRALSLAGSSPEAPAEAERASSGSTASLPAIGSLKGSDTSTERVPKEIPGSSWPR